MIIKSDSTERLTKLIQQKEARLKQWKTKFAFFPVRLTEGSEKGNEVWLDFYEESGETIHRPLKLEKGIGCFGGPVVTGGDFISWKRRLKRDK